MSKQYLITKFLNENDYEGLSSVWIFDIGILFRISITRKSGYPGFRISRGVS
jgi:hypothetical protein